ncbi:MAG: HAD-superfamily hydrolase, subfamily IA, variant 3 [Elusimicrobia bacterium]|nr:MAG: HAD-superfamily hydrolase, subfamily IA, variant 3 [Elusimicrobiota bacterium]
MAPPKALLFDFGGTLDDDGRPWLERFRPLWRAEGARVPEAALDRAFYDADDNLPKRHDLAGLDLAATVALQCADAGRVLLPHDPAAAERVARRVVAESRAALARNKPVLERLARRFKLAVVSNFYGNLEGILAAEGLLGLFGAVADSGQVGAEKPDAAIFQWALSRLGVSASEAWMVGDSLKRDMAGAERLGMGHVWLAGPDPKTPPCCADARVLASLTGLEALLAPAEAAR